MCAVLLTPVIPMSAAGQMHDVCAVATHLRGRAVLSELSLGAHMPTLYDVGICPNAALSQVSRDGVPTDISGVVTSCLGTVKRAASQLRAVPNLRRAHGTLYAELQMPSWQACL